MYLSRPFQFVLITAAALSGCADPANPFDVGTGGMLPATTGGVIADTGGGLNTGGIAATGGIQMGTGGVMTSGNDIPCEVAEVLTTHCAKCHGETTNWGGPMSLTQLSDFAAMGKLTTTSPVDALVKARIHDVNQPMPPVTELAMPDSDRDILSTWLDAGRPAGKCDEDPMGTGGVVSATGGAEDGTGGTQWVSGETSWPGGVMPEETCYEFLKHGGQGAGDTTPHMTRTGETYVNFYYTVPWTEPVVATRWRTIYDNTAVLHHWLLYKSAGPRVDETWEEQIGTHPGARLVAGWAVGGGDETFPPGVGLRMPAPGESFELEWHLYNTSGAQVPDRSGIEVCVVPESKVDPRFVAGLTWLGTENITVPARSEAKNGGICEPSFKNTNLDSIHIVKWLPHMHTIGKHMDTWVLRADGSQEHVFSKPFTFDRQISYDQNPPVVIEQGDKVFAECTFQNDSSQTVLFGQSTDQEMCYQFAVSYPAGSLDGAVPITLTGSDNTCFPPFSQTLPAF